MTTLLASDGKANKVVVALGTGDGRFSSPILVAVSDDLAGTAAADFDGDGFLDLAVTKSTSGAGTVEVFFGNGDGTFGSPEKYSTPVRQPIAAAVGDLNGDAQSDVIFVNDSLSVGILINNGE